MNVEHLSLHAEKAILRQLDLHANHLRLLGGTSVSSLSLLISQLQDSRFHRRPHFIVTPRHNDALRLHQALQFFDPTREVFVLPHYDVSPYSGLYPKHQNVAERLGFLFHLQNAKPGQIFISSVGGVLQKTLPYPIFHQKTFHLKKGDELPEDFAALVEHLGYISTPYTEDHGQYSRRGGIIDIFSPAHPWPLRLELFGDQIESIRGFDPVAQKSHHELSSCTIIPTREALFDDDRLESLLEQLRKDLLQREVAQEDGDELLFQMTRQHYFSGCEFLLPYFYKKLDSVFEYTNCEFFAWNLDPIELTKHSDEILSNLKEERLTATKAAICPKVEDLYLSYDQFQWPIENVQFDLFGIDLSSETENDPIAIPIPYATIRDLASTTQQFPPNSTEWNHRFQSKLELWKQDQDAIFVAVRNQNQAQRIQLALEKLGWNGQILPEDSYVWDQWVQQQRQRPKTIHLVPRELFESFRLSEEKLIFLRDEDFLGKKLKTRNISAQQEFQEKASRLSFGELKPGDCVVHMQHGIGVYDGLKVMSIGGVDSEFIQISYKDKDKLYLPVYRIGQIQKYSGNAQTTSLDKLGGTGWEKTKSKVKNHLRDIASELLELYAKRSILTRPAFHLHSEEITAFENSFPYDETDDQLRALSDIKKDMTSDKPMDRLICGDVGFGKTEVAMRAAFIAAHERKQVAVLAPTTVLSFQHWENFKKRFQGWPLDIRALNRFVPASEVKQTLSDVASGKVDILIGTHRLLSKDVNFKNLGLLIVDEEQKFGVTHKERIKKMKTSVDTLALSATPIPRTLNMSLMGLRDLSIINTAPVDRLPTRTFITRFDPEVIRKGILSEVQRGGQVFFIHNRVQSIYGLADELRNLVPEVRLKVAHGQMDEEELEKTMVAFFHHEIDVLVCTTIVESGIDIPDANTMFIHDAHMMGLSQLYQLRGRVGRSKKRAYCYLILPKERQIDKDAQERLKVIQENSALGSGIRIAQYDLEQRGAGNMLGEEQSGQINLVGYEMYMDLLNETIHEMKGEPGKVDTVEPEINLRIPAMIPESYIPDIRIRLSYYKALSEIKSSEDLDRIEDELRDQFGQIPEPTLNLMGLMLIRKQCKDLGVLDVSAGVKTLSLKFSPTTRLSNEVIIKLAMRENKKYSITPDSRLNVRMNQITWPAVHEELEYLNRLV
jgi:transcription-repair coupling factor (superfamily II helicase)